VDWDFIGKVLLIAGGCIIVLGLIFLFAERIPFVGKLPGDIFIEKGRFSFYFPIVTCILASAVLSLILGLVLWLLHR
jgi:hypothetical protein